MREDEPTIRVMALHALSYCERLFYLEEVEEIRVADEAVWEGRRLHVELEEPHEVVDLTLESERLGIRGRLDAVRQRDGATFPIEHKRGRARRLPDKTPQAWESDRLQALAYALLLQEHSGREVTEARVRYHRDGVTVRIPVTAAAAYDVGLAVRRARELRRSVERPAVTREEGKCVRCSLAPVCLPEEARHAAQEGDRDAAPPLRLFPPDLERRSLHVVTQGAKVGRTGEAFRVVGDDATRTDVGAREVSDIVVHGFAQVTTQALRLCADEEIPVHYVTQTGTLIGTFSRSSVAVQRRLRQMKALSDEAMSLGLARTLVQAKVEMQLRFLLRGSRKEDAARSGIEPQLVAIRAALRGVAHAKARDELMGHEGIAARVYFDALASLVLPEVGDAMRPQGRSRRPPRDPFNALLSFGYGLLYRDMISAAIRVGVEPALGMLHQPRSSAMPLALDLMELFRVPIVDMAVLAAVNRRTFDPDADFARTGPQVWLSEAGRLKAIELYERRKHEEYRHDVLGFSLSYARMMELEVRLLEKEWSGEPGMFARFRIR